MGRAPGENEREADQNRCTNKQRNKGSKPHEIVVQTLSSEADSRQTRGGSRQKYDTLKTIMTDMPRPFPGNDQEIDFSVLGV